MSLKNTSAIFFLLGFGAGIGQAYFGEWPNGSHMGQAKMSLLGY